MPKPRKLIVTIECETCRNHFDVFPSRIREAEKNGKKVRFCSMTCYNKSGVRMPPHWTPEVRQKWLNNPSRSKFKSGKLNPNMHRYGTWFGYSSASKHLRGTITACQLCGWGNEPAVLEIHHMDHDRLNNKLDNVKLICPNCHSIQHYVLRTGKFHRLGKKKTVEVSNA